jgi:hypothetical protein
MIDQIVDAWKRQLKSTTAPMGIPSNFSGQVPAAMPESNPLAPWNFWLQATEMLQRTWMPQQPRRGSH